MSKKVMFLWGVLVLLALFMVLPVAASADTDPPADDSGIEVTFTAVTAPMALRAAAEYLDDCRCQAYAASLTNLVHLERVLLTVYIYPMLDPPDPLPGPPPGPPPDERDISPSTLAETAPSLSSAQNYVAFKGFSVPAAMREAADWLDRCRCQAYAVSLNNNPYLERVVFTVYFYPYATGPLVNPVI